MDRVRPCVAVTALTAKHKTTIATHTEGGVSEGNHGFPSAQEGQPWLDGRRSYLPPSRHSADQYVGVDSRRSAYTFFQ